MATAKKRAVRRGAGARVPPLERRRQLVEVASELLTGEGLEQVQITEVAERAGVSRPLVYRLFPTRKALLRAVLEDFVADLEVRFHAALLRAWPGTLDSTTRAFIDACCDAIEARGAGPWVLLDTHCADPELGRLGRTVLAGMLAPWKERLASLGGLGAARAETVLRVVVAAGRAALDEWIEGKSTRAQASEYAVRAVSALLHALAVAPPEPEAPARKPARPRRAKR